MSKVMIVDDDRTTVKLLQTLLELDGFEVQTVSRGMDAMPKALANRPHLVLMDYHLSDMEGVDIIRDMRRDAQLCDLPIVMTSGMDVEYEAMEAGATAFLLKPFDPDELPALFSRLMEAKPD
jgi:DNA-binding response OmpR family regulator